MTRSKSISLLKQPSLLAPKNKRKRIYDTATLEKYRKNYIRNYKKEQRNCENVENVTLGQKKALSPPHWTHTQVQSLYSAIFSTPPHTANYWHKIASKVPGKSSQDCNSFYLLASSTGHGKKRKQKASDTAPTIKDITNQLTQQKSQSKTMTKKRLYRDLLKAVDAQHREDIYSDEMNQRRKALEGKKTVELQRNATSTQSPRFSAITTTPVPPKRSSLTPSSLDASFSFLDESFDDAQRRRSSHNSPSIVTPLKLHTTKLSPSQETSPLESFYISPGVIRPVQMQHIDTLANKILKQQKGGGKLGSKSSTMPQPRFNFARKKLNAVNQQQAKNVRAELRPDLFENTKILDAKKEEDVDSDEEMLECISDVEE